MKCLVLVALLIVSCECVPTKSCDGNRFEVDLFQCHQKMVDEITHLSEDEDSAKYADAVCRGLVSIHRCYEDIARKTGCLKERIEEIEEAMEVGRQWLLNNKNIKC